MNGITCTDITWVLTNKHVFISGAIARKYLLTETIVNCNFAKLILQNANLPLVLLLQNIVDESCLTGSEEASDDGDRGEVLFVVGHGCFVCLDLCGGSGRREEIGKIKISRARNL